jgi:hypothetical protein
MPYYGYGISLSSSRTAILASSGSVPFSPTDLSGLSLWLKADAGVSTTPEQFISQIIISGAGTTTSNGTYTRASGGLTTFNGPNGNYINNTGGAEWALFDTQLYDPDNENYGNDSYFTEDFANWIIAGANLGESPAPSGTITNSPTGINLVTAWADQSGNGNNASANSGEEPTFVSSFLFGKPAIRFNGQAQVMQIADSNSLDFLNTSCFIVLQYIGQGTGNNIVYFKNANAGSPEDPAMYGMVAKTAGDGLVSFSMNVNGWADHQTSIDLTDTEPRILTMLYDGTDQKVYSNGALSDTFNIGGNIATSTGLFQIGGYNQSFNAAEYFNGRIAEIIMYNRWVNATERQQVEQYLNSKYEVY